MLKIYSLWWSTCNCLVNKGAIKYSWKLSLEIKQKSIWLWRKEAERQVNFYNSWEIHHVIKFEGRTHTSTPKSIFTLNLSLCIIHKHTSIITVKRVKCFIVLWNEIDVWKVKQSLWILLFNKKDFGDFFSHLLLDDKRNFYVFSKRINHKVLKS